MSMYLKWAILFYFCAAASEAGAIFMCAYIFMDQRRHDVFNFDFHKRSTTPPPPPRNPDAI